MLVLRSGLVNKNASLLTMFLIVLGCGGWVGGGYLLKQLGFGHACWSVGFWGVKAKNRQNKFNGHEYRAHEKVGGGENGLFGIYF